MSEYTYCTTYKGRDLEVVYDASFGSDYKHGDFDLDITAIHLDINLESRNGEDLIEEFDDDEIDELSQMICENDNFYEKATEELIGRADWLRDQRKDNQR